MSAVQSFRSSPESKPESKPESEFSGSTIVAPTAEFPFRRAFPNNARRARARQRSVSFLAKQLEWFASLDASDKVGVILMMLTGLGFIVMLARSGMNFNFNLIPGAEASSVLRSSCRASLPPGCEQFLLEQGPSPFSRRARVIVVPFPEEVQIKTCLNAIDEARQQPHTVYIPQIPSGLKINCTGQLEGHDYGDSPFRTCVGFDRSDILARERQYRGFSKASFGLLQLSVMEKKHPELSSLNSLSREDAARVIAVYLKNFFQKLNIASEECDIPTVRALSDVDFNHEAQCVMKKMLKNFLWQVHREGFDVALDKNFKRFKTVLEALTLTPDSIAARMIAVVAELQEFAERANVREYAVVVMDMCVTNPEACRPEVAHIFAPVRKAVELLSNTSVLVI